MDTTLQHDLTHLDDILTLTRNTAAAFLHGLADRPVGVIAERMPAHTLPERGLGAAATLDLFHRTYADLLTGSAGPRYLGFVVGGVTPAALAGDWLVSTFDQNAIGSNDGSAPQIEYDALGLLRQLFALPDAFTGAFVSGATLSNFVGLAQARQWAAQRLGHNVAQDGLYGLPPITVLSGAPHSVIYKGMSMLGMGRSSMRLIPLMPGREAVDIVAMRAALQELGGAPAIIVGNAGTVNTVDFDDLAALADLRDEYGAWLHIDAAFGGFAACSPSYRHLTAGWEAADTIAIDLHKWLNVPYDSAVQFTRHRDLQLEVFRNAAAYLETGASEPEFVHLTPESSRRLRALPAWCALMAYGAAGHCTIVEHDCALAQLLGQQIASSPAFELLAPVRMNVVCFTLAGEPSKADIRRFLDQLHATGEVFMTPTVYAGRPAIRAAFSNWRTTETDVARVWAALCRIADA